MAPLSGGRFSNFLKKGGVPRIALGKQHRYLKLGFPEPVFRLRIEHRDGSHSFLIGREFRGAGWLCWCLGSVRPQAAAVIRKELTLGWGQGSLMEAAWGCRGSTALGVLSS